VSSVLLPAALVALGSDGSSDGSSSGATSRSEAGPMSVMTWRSAGGWCVYKVVPPKL
jgi:hypothetical protein